MSPCTSPCALIRSPYTDSTVLPRAPTSGAWQRKSQHQATATAVALWTISVLKSKRLWSRRLNKAGGIIQERQGSQSQGSCLRHGQSSERESCLVLWLGLPSLEPTIGAIEGTVSQRARWALGTVLHTTTPHFPPPVCSCRHIKRSRGEHGTCVGNKHTRDLSNRGYPFGLAVPPF